MLKVERKRTFTRIGAHEDRRESLIVIGFIERIHLPPLVPDAGLFDLNDVGAHQSELERRVGPSDHLSEVDNPNPFESTHILAPPFSEIPT